MGTCLRHEIDVNPNEGGPSEEALRKMKHDGGVVRDWLYANQPAGAAVTVKSVSHLLSAHVENPVQVGNKMLTLHSRKSTADNTSVFFVSKTDPSGD